MAKKEVTKGEQKNADIRRTINVPVQLYRITTNLALYRNAVLAAENILLPQRYQLYQIENMAMLDAHLTAAIQQRKNLILSRKFCVYNSDGSENEEKSKVICKKWFRDYLDLALDSIFWGHSLIQFDDIINVNGEDEFKDVYLVPRIFVKPEFHLVTPDYASQTGDDYLEMPWRNWIIGVGKPRDLGLLLNATPLVIWKKNAIGAWAEYVEKFGNPARIGYTAVRDELTRSNMENMLKNMGTSLYAVLDTDDKVEYKESQNQDAYMVFDMMIQRCNSEISKLILGQTSTMEEKAFTGSAEVHERVLNGYKSLDEQLIYGVNNYQLVPLLNANGFGLEGMSIGCEPEEDFDMQQKAKFAIDLLNTGKYKFAPEYLKENFGVDAIEVAEPEPTTVQTIKNYLDELYS